MSFSVPSYANKDLRILIDLLLSAHVGDIVTYESMSKALGSPIGRRRWMIPKAVRIANEEAGVLFAVVVNRGQKRLPSDESYILGDATRRRIRRSSQQSSDMISRSIRMANDMPEDAKRKAYAEINTLGLIKHLSYDRSVSIVESYNKPMSVAEVARATLTKIGAISEKASSQ